MASFLLIGPGVAFTLPQDPVNLSPNFLQFVLFFSPPDVQNHDISFPPAQHFAS
jgi:hypothetical protein